jgi:hypothetical protein
MFWDILAVVFMLGSLHVAEQISKRLGLNEGWRIVMVDKVFAETGGSRMHGEPGSKNVRIIRHSFFERITKTKNVRRIGIGQFILDS